VVIKKHSTGVEVAKQEGGAFQSRASEADLASRKLNGQTMPITSYSRQQATVKFCQCKLIVQEDRQGCVVNGFGHPV
jgi:hypothetical protein